MTSFQSPPEQNQKSLLSLDYLDPSLRISYLEVLTKLEKWNIRFPHKMKDSIFNDLCFFYIHNAKESISYIGTRGISFAFFCLSIS